MARGSDKHVGRMDQEPASTRPTAPHDPLALAPDRLLPALLRLISHPADFSMREVRVWLKVADDSEGSMLEIADELDVSHATVRRALGRLVKHGFVSRSPKQGKDPQTGKWVPYRCTITDAVDEAL